MFALQTRVRSRRVKLDPACVATLFISIRVQVGASSERSPLAILPSMLSLDERRTVLYGLCGGHDDRRLAGAKISAAWIISANCPLWHV
jgi:hypothetical protein